MDTRTHPAAERADSLFQAHQQAIIRRTDRLFAGLLIFEWLAGIVAAVWISPRTWAGAGSWTHLHVWAALWLGLAIVSVPVFLAIAHPGKSLTRHVIAVGQMLVSALLIHLSGGRIETHFHIFGSLAFLAFYRDWRVLITATLIVAADHILRGLYWPQSVYGTAAASGWRWLEHAGWVVFEDVFLILSCLQGRREMRDIAERDARLEAQNADLEQQVETRTAALRDANARLEALATTDALTGLPNHRTLISVIEQEMERCVRYDHPFALLFLDLDHFKALNDSCGHAAGDAALCELGKVMRSCLRGIDSLGRWGGEEFIALLPETDVQQAQATAEKIRAAVAAHVFSAGNGVHMTCSVGVAVYPDEARDRHALIEAADRAMYAAKRMGRNQVRLVSDPALDVLEYGEESSREEIAMLGIAEALAALVEARDAYTGEHVNSVAALTMRLAEAMGLEALEVRQVGLIGKLHDIGKVGIPDAILRKPGQLTEEEWALMRLHPIIGADVVSRIPTLRAAAPGIRAHHERWDGQGYPDGLAGDAIPLGARIVSVVDSYGAMTTDRPYRQARDTAWALGELRRCAGTQFDPDIVATFERMLAANIQAADIKKAA